MKIYTKRGDTGLTDLIGGARVQKDDCRVEAYGTADELNSFVGLLRAEALPFDIDELLGAVQNRLFDIGAYLASVDEASAEENSFQAGIVVGCAQDTESLETAIDTWTSELPVLRGFILPCGSRSVALAHVCRTICRRLERGIVSLTKSYQIAGEVLQYVNRLSDFFFVLSKKMTVLEGGEFFLWKK